jgi:hypothetical protein
MGFDSPKSTGQAYSFVFTPLIYLRKYLGSVGSCRTILALYRCNFIVCQDQEFFQVISFDILMVLRSLALQYPDYHSTHCCCVA